MPTLRHRINFLPAYPEERRRRWDAEDDRRCEHLEQRVTELEAEVERLKRRAA